MKGKGINCIFDLICLELLDHLFVCMSSSHHKPKSSQVIPLYSWHVRSEFLPGIWICNVCVSLCWETYIAKGSLLREKYAFVKCKSQILHIGILSCKVYCIKLQFTVFKDFLFSAVFQAYTVIVYCIFSSVSSLMTRHSPPMNTSRRLQPWPSIWKKIPMKKMKWRKKMWKLSRLP